MNNKYRAWDTVRNEYLSAGRVLLSIEPKRNPVDGKVFLDVLEYEVKDGRFIIEQFTGFKDKKGTEIYEGDVISFLYTKKVTILPVCWGIGSWWAKGVGWFKDLREIFDRCEVVGNIHETPQLLKGA